MEWESNRGLASGQRPSVGRYERAGEEEERLTGELHLFYDRCHRCRRAGRRLPGGKPAMSAAAVSEILEA